MNEKKSMKFRVSDAAHSADIQEALFKMGIRWQHGAGVEIKLVDKPILTVDGEYIHWTLQTHFDKVLKPEYILLDGEIVPAGSVSKPPLGLRPRSVVDALRYKEVGEAMARYIMAGMDIPDEWLVEFKTLHHEKRRR